MGSLKAGIRPNSLFAQGLSKNAYKKLKVPEGYKRVETGVVFENDEHYNLTVMGFRRLPSDQVGLQITPEHFVIRKI